MHHTPRFQQHATGDKVCLAYLRDAGRSRQPIAVTVEIPITVANSKVVGTESSKMGHLRVLRGAGCSRQQAAV